MSHELKPVCLADMSWSDIHALRFKPAEVRSGEHNGKKVVLLEPHHTCDTVIVQFGDGIPNDHIKRECLFVDL